MSYLHELARTYNDRIAQSGRDGEIQWIVVGNGLKLIYTEDFERRNGLRMRSGAEQERRFSAYRNEQAADGQSTDNMQSEGFL